MGVFNLINKLKKAREEKRFEVPCTKCGKIFNAQKQSGICPHIPIEEFIFGKKDKITKD
jgi:rRNA maturation endonuclease Nob1